MGRRSLFYLHDAPLLVTEVFLPVILLLTNPLKCAWNPAQKSLSASSSSDDARLFKKKNESGHLRFERVRLLEASVTSKS